MFYLFIAWCKITYFSVCCKGVKLEYFTLLAKELSKLDSVSNIQEELLRKGGKTTKAYKIDFDYAKFPLTGLEVTDGAGLRFINLRLTISYPRDKYSVDFVLKVLNDFNSTSVCLKAFYVDDGDNNKDFDIAYNIEDVFLASEHDLGPALEKKIEMLVRGPLSVHKEMDKE